MCFFFFQMVTVNSLQAIYKLLCANPDTTTLSKQLNAQLINVRRKSTNCYNLSKFLLSDKYSKDYFVWWKNCWGSVQNLVSKINLVCIRVVLLCPVILKTLHHLVNQLYANLKSIEIKVSCYFPASQFQFSSWCHTSFS